MLFRGQREKAGSVHQHAFPLPLEEEVMSKAWTPRAPKLSGNGEKEKCKPGCRKAGGLLGGPKQPPHFCVSRRPFPGDTACCWLWQELLSLLVEHDLFHHFFENPVPVLSCALTPSHFLTGDPQSAQHRVTDDDLHFTHYEK